SSAQMSIFAHFPQHAATSSKTAHPWLTTAVYGLLAGLARDYLSGGNSGIRGGEMAPNFILWFEDIAAGDTGSVGGKNASLGEMVRNLGPYGITVPPGFAITADAYRHFLSANNLEPLIAAKLAELKGGKVSDAEIGLALRAPKGTPEWPKDLAEGIFHAYRDLSRRLGADEADVAVRSSATAEDLPEASFAGQQETFLNIHGEAALLDAARCCFASLFTDRAISYREAKG